MRASLLIVLALLALVACKSKNKIPGNIIPQPKMQAILWDLMRADQFLADYVLNRDTTKKKETESLIYYQQIFAIHKINRDEFERSFSFYRSRPDLLRTIMDSISAPSRQQPTVVAPPEKVATPVIADTPKYPRPRIQQGGKPIPATGN